MPPTLERTLLESHLRLLLDKLESGDTPDPTPGKRPESEPADVARNSELSTARQSLKPRTTRDYDERGGRHSGRVCLSGSSTNRR